MNNRSLAVFIGGCAMMFVLAASVSASLADSGTRAFDKSMQPVLASYLMIHRSLANDSTQGVQAHARSLAEAAGGLRPEKVAGGHAAHYAQLPARLQRAAKALANSTGLERAREAFKHLSKPMATWVTMSKPGGVDVVFCAMANAAWVQKAGEVRNPYYGKSMLNCGDVIGKAGGSTAPGEHQGHGDAVQGNGHRMSSGAGHSQGPMGHTKHGGCSGH